MKKSRTLQHPALTEEKERNPLIVSTEDKARYALSIGPSFNSFLNRPRLNNRLHGVCVENNIGGTELNKNYRGIKVS
jgi:hypothetical protein